MAFLFKEEGWWNFVYTDIFE